MNSNSQKYLKLSNLIFFLSLESCNLFVNRRDVQFNQVSKLEAQLSTIQAVVVLVQERIKALEIAMKVAREVRRVPNLGQYCTLDSVCNLILIYIQTIDCL